MSTSGHMPPPQVNTDGMHFFDTGHDHTSVLAQPGRNRILIAHASNQMTASAARALAQALNSAADLAEQPTPPLRPVPPEHIGVHTSHCCQEHGCKYGNNNCPVTTGLHPQEFRCELCADDELHERP